MRRERSNSAYLLAGGLLSIGEQRSDELFVAKKIRDDEVRADAGEPLALPFVYCRAQRLRRCHTDRYAADFLDVLDLHVPIAESQKLAPTVFGCGDQPLDQNLFRKTLVIVERSENTA